MYILAFFFSETIYRGLTFHGYYNLLYELCEKVLPVALTLIFLLFILCIPTGLFLNSLNKKFNPNNSIGRKYCLLNALKLLLMYLFVTLFIRKLSGSNNQQFHFHNFKSENKEKLLTNSTICTFEEIGKSILGKQLSQGGQSKVHLSKFGSYFKFILLLFR